MKPKPTTKISKVLTMLLVNAIALTAIFSLARTVTHFVQPDTLGLMFIITVSGYLGYQIKATLMDGKE